MEQDEQNFNDKMRENHKDSEEGKNNRKHLEDGKERLRKKVTLFCLGIRKGYEICNNYFRPCMRLSTSLQQKIF